MTKFKQINRSSNWTIFGVLVIFSLIGLIPIYSYYKQVLNMLDSKNWPSTNGMIVDSEMTQSQGEYGFKFTPHIIYKYKVEKELYQNNVYSYGAKLSGDHKDAEATLNQFKKGKRVTVYYNPKKPQIAVLQTGFYFTPILYFLLFLSFPLIGFIGSIFLLRDYLKSRKKLKGKKA